MDNLTYSDDDLDEEILLQTEDYPHPSPGLVPEVPSTTTTLPQADLVTTATNDGGEGKTCRNVHADQVPHAPSPPHAQGVYNLIIFISDKSHAAFDVHQPCITCVVNSLCLYTVQPVT